MDYGVGSATLDSAATGWGLTEGAGAAAAKTAAGGGAFDWLTSALSGSVGDAVTSAAGDAVKTVGSSLFNNDWLTTALSLIGAGVNQYNIEKAAEDQRKWLDQKDIDRRRRQAPGALPAMKTTVYTKGGG